MTKELSHKIKAVSFILMIMVVFLHSYNIDIKQGANILVIEKGYNWIIQEFISNGITRIAVPLFFLISGYMFFLDGKVTIPNFIHKIGKRVKTLLLPYLIWALFGLLLYYVLQSIPQSQPFFTKKLIKDYSFIEWLNGIFVNPIPYQLWFLRDLIVIVLLSPLLYVLIIKVKEFFLIAVFVFWICNQDAVFLTSEAVLFFSLGSYIKLFQDNVVTKKADNYVLYISLWILILIIKTIIGYYDVSKVTELILLKLSILIGLPAFWLYYDRISGIFKPIEKYFWTSFFIYVFHEPFLTIAKKGIFYTLSKTQFSYMLIYFTAPVLTIFMCILTAILLNKLPNLYKVISGNRNP